MIRHVLLDADGVVQSLPGGWVPALERHLGAGAADFLAAASVDERPCLRGEGDFLDVLADHLSRRGATVEAADLHRAVWTSIVPEPDTLALAAQLRAAGVGVHLATNQERHRAAHMRQELGYDALFDHCLVSCDLAAAKPDPGFFEAALAVLDAPAREVLLVDDSAANVRAARAHGLAAEQWHLDDGIDELRARLAAYGLVRGR